MVHAMKVPSVYDGISGKKPEDGASNVCSDRSEDGNNAPCLTSRRLAMTCIMVMKLQKGCINAVLIQENDSCFHLKLQKVTFLCSLI